MDLLSAVKQLQEARYGVFSVAHDELPKPAGLADAYQAQLSVLADEQLAFGCKVAMANKPAMQRFDLDEPLYGWLTADMLVTGEDLSASQLLAPVLESEVAFIMGADLNSVYVTDDDILAAVGHMAPAFEVADSRITNWAFDKYSMTLDNAAASFIKLGDYVPFEADIFASQQACELVINGDAMTGNSDAILGGPIATLITAVRHMLAQQGKVSAGQIIMSGTWHGPIKMQPGQSYLLSMLGTVLKLNYR